MADIKTTVDGMPKADLLPDAPSVSHPAPVDVTVTKIKAIAKELARPWRYGTALHRIARLHGVSVAIVKEIQEAVAEKAVTLAPVEPLEGGKL